MDIAAAAQEQLELLRAAGIRCALDPADLNPPAVLLNPPTLVNLFAKASYEATWSAWAIVADTGTRNSLTALSAFVNTVQAALDWKVTGLRPDMVRMPDGGDLPCYVLTYTTRIQGSTS